jgi:radical SAM protein with 4Fe4S-binding SPASM domain
MKNLGLSKSILNGFDSQIAGIGKDNNDAARNKTNKFRTVGQMRYGGIIREEGTIRLADHVMLREERFGGLVFNANTGDILEVDREAFNLLVWLRRIGAAGVGELARQKDIRAILSKLLSMGIIEYFSKDAAEQCVGPFEQTPSSGSDGTNRNQHHLSAPETVHLAVTYRCDNTCIDCYSRKHAQYISTELDTLQMCGVIDKISDSGVFQLAIGGGEPFVRNDLGLIVKHAASKGLLVHVTTGQYSPNQTLAEVMKHIKSLHVGIRTDELLANAETDEQLRVLSECVYKSRVRLGANLIMTRQTIDNAEKILGILVKHGFGRVIFLRYKPISNDARWSAENPKPDELRSFQRWLVGAKRRYRELMLRIDCAASFMIRDAVPTDALHRGIKGCTAGDRIISVAPDGSMFPCSQLVGRPFFAGNLAKDAFETIWHESDVLDKYRNFRKSESFSGSVCGKCSAMPFCGGCRVFADDSIGGEPFCPIEQ